MERSLPQAIAEAAARHPERGIGLSDGRGRHFEHRPYAELLRSARASAARLAALGVEEGDRVVVCLPTGWNWFDAWLGSVLLGALPVAAAPAAPGASKAGQARRVEGILARLEARLLVCDPGVAAEVRRDPQRRTAATVVIPAELAASPPARHVAAARPDPGSTAFLQLTSGSTGEPRAVMVPHRAVLHQARVQDEVVGAPFGVRSRELFDALVSWLPLYHDMGLLGVFYTLLNGRDLWLMPPQAFLARPRAFLELAAARGVTVSAAPNFGYQLCVERVTEEEASALDLSSFRAALTGAEMVRSDTIEAFCERFAAAGFARRSFRPCYGLAEATLAVTLDRAGEGARTVPAPGTAEAGLGLKELVSNGPPVADTEVAIMAPDGSERPAGEVGEVWVKGPSVFLGYYNDDEATAESLEGGWLRTGDLGFLDRGDLFIAGRLKDLLIVRGQNLMPHEFERLAESASRGGGSCRAAAFSVARGPQGEEVVVVLEAAGRDASRLAAVSEAVRSRIGRELGLPLADVVFVRRGRVPKTTSGKVKRGEVRRRYLEGRLERLW